MPLLENKVCVITGGCGSVGLASARRFVSEGAKVMLVDVDEARVAAAAAAFDAAAVATFVGDVADADAVRGYLQAAVSRWGPIVMLFSNAGNPGHIAKLEE
jgi:NADP-dependent 3-hydroxy acid dehydrogenase YdfG